METYFIGIDLGTSSLKSILMRADGTITAAAAREYPIHHPRPDWSEQDPEDWVRAAVDTTREVIGSSSVAPRQIAGISFSGQMHGMVVLDESGKPLREAIIWADQRSSAQARRVVETLGKETLAEWTGNPLTSGFMLASWLWVREHEPELTARAAQLLLPKDYLRYRLCGALGSEPSDAGSTLLFDTARRRWHAGLLDAFEIDPGLLPPIHESADCAGGLLPDMAEKTGLKAGTPVYFGAGDQAAQALGNGIIAPGVLSCTIGTGGQLFAPIDAPRFDPELRLHLFCHAIPNRWHFEAATLSAGLSLRWLRDNVFDRGLDYQQIADGAAQIEPGAEGLFFLPDLAGARTPNMDPASRACFSGLTLRHDRRHLSRAVMEGVVLELRQGFELMTSLGARAEKLVASGGGTRHPLWLQLQADIFNRPIYRARTHEAAVVGAAMLAAIGAGVYASAADAVEQVVRWEEEVIYPDPDRAARYEALYPAFCRLYDLQKTIQGATA